jgi:hypothetical protein
VDARVLKLELDAAHLVATPGEPVICTARVFHGGTVVDAFEVTVVGVGDAPIEIATPELSLFPGESAEVAVAIPIPRNMPAGPTVAAVEVVSVLDPTRRAVAELVLEVSDVDDVAVRVEPEARTTRHKARFEVAVSNQGNRDLELTLSGRDAPSAGTYRFRPDRIVVRHGERATVPLELRVKRRFAGGVTPMPFTISATSHGKAATAGGMLQRKALVPRGALTGAAVLAAVVVWGLVLWAGFERIADSTHDSVAGNGDLASSSDDAAAGSDDAAGADGGGGEAGAEGEAVEIGISGTATDGRLGAPLGGVTVAAVAADGQTVVSSAASSPDGTYRIGGLEPGGHYRLHFTMPGYTERWYPDAGEFSGAEELELADEGDTTDVEQALVGLPGSIGGTLGPSDGGADVPVSIRPLTVPSASTDDGGGGSSGDAVALDAPRRSAAARTAPAQETDPGDEAAAPGAGEGFTITTDAEGRFSFADLPTPGRYEITIAPPEADPRVITVDLAPGQAYTLGQGSASAGLGEGSISGQSFDLVGPIGGVAVTVTGEGTSLSVTTPTSGDIGLFTVSGLPTPGLYTVTFAKDGFGLQARTVTLDAEQDVTGVDVTLQGGTASVTGTAYASVGGRLGGVAITATDGETTYRTVSGTDGDDVGTYTLVGLVTPGRYTVTFSLDGFATSAQDLDLTQTAVVEGFDAVLVPGTATLQGTVTLEGVGLGGVEIVVSDGTTVRTTTTADDPPGQYRLDGLPNGVYTVTISPPGFATQVTQVRVREGESQILPLVIVQGRGAIAGRVVTSTGETTAGAVQVVARGPVSRAVSAGADGRYVISSLPPGTYTVDVTSRGYTPVTVTGVVVRPDQNSSVDATLFPQPGTVGGRITGPVTSLTSQPLADVQVTLYLEPGGFVWDTRVTGADGTYSFTPLPTGVSFSVGAVTPSGSHQPRRSPTVSVGPGQARVVNVQLNAATGSIAGRVVDTSGDPVEGVVVSARGLTTATLGTTDATGTFAMPPCPNPDPSNVCLETPSTYTVTFTLIGYETRSISVPLAPGADVDVGDVELTPFASSIAGTVTGRFGPAVGDVGPIPNVTVIATGPDGGTTVRTTTTDASGTYLMAAMPSGSWVVEFQLAGYSAPAPATVDVVPTVPTVQDAVLTPLPGSLAGQIDDRLGPRTGVPVTLIPPSPPSTTTTSGSGGVYSVTTPLEPFVAYQLAVNRPGDPGANGGFAAVAATIVAGPGQAVFFDVVLEGNPGSISGTATPADPASIETLRVDVVEDSVPAHGAAVTASVTTNAATGWAFSLPPLPTPGTYHLEFVLGTTPVTAVSGLPSSISLAPLTTGDFRSFTIVLG